MVPDDLWGRIEPLLPVRQRRPSHPGRLPLDDHGCLQGILFVLHTGIQWERLADRPWFDGPIFFLPVAQLHARDVSFPRLPGADLLQVLWCPFDHEMARPRTALFWRSSATVTEVLDAPPPLGVGAGNFTLIDIVGGYNLRLHVCPTSPDRPHIELPQ